MNKNPQKETRSHKLALKLRENLRKRKAQIKARASGDKAPSAGDDQSSSRGDEQK